MIKSILPLLLVLIAIFSTGCSTMLSPEKTSVYIKSQKEGQVFVVKDNKGIVVAKAITPAVIKLDNKGDSSYTYQTQCESKLEKSEINSWVIGNLITVSISGMLIDLANGYSNEPVDRVSLINCDTIAPKKRVVITRGEECGDYVDLYDRSIYSFNNKHEKKSIYNLKYTQDYLLRNCSNYVDVSHYLHQESTINKVYASYL